MRRHLPLAAVFTMALLATACTKPLDEVIPLPEVSTRDAVGYFCGMIVEDHQGPKSQILLAGEKAAVWFTSVRDGIAYSLLPEETSKISAFYVTAMDKSTWDHPEQQASAWIDAKTAWYVIESNKTGGMGAPEAIPFANANAATMFVASHGGRTVSYSDMPEQYILGHGQTRENEVATDVAQ